MIRVIRPAGVPFLATAAITTVTSSPALNVLAVKPKLTSVDGALFSQIQCTTLPFSSVTSTIKNECGFVHSHCVTFPLMVTSLFSYDAFPWCANTEVEPVRRTNNSRLAGNSLFIKPCSNFKLERPGWLAAARVYACGKQRVNARRRSQRQGFGGIGG